VLVGKKQEGEITNWIRLIEKD